MAANIALPAVEFVIHNPWTIASFGGVFAGLRFGFLKLFFRRDRLVLLPHDQLSYITQSKNQLIGRWKVKGSQLVRAADGVQYRLQIRSRAEDLKSTALTQQLMIQILEQSQLSRKDPAD